MSFGAQQSSSSSSSGSFVQQEQLGYLTDLWSQASGMMNPTGAQGAASTASGFANPYLQQAMGNMAGLTNPQAQIDAQSSSLQSGLGSLFRDEINPAIQGNAIAMGGFGGGRQGVAEGVATGQLADAYTQGYGDIVARANQGATGAALAMPGLAQSYMTNAMSPYTAALDPYAQLAQILGRPTVLNQSESESESAGFNFGLPGFGG